MTLTDAKIDGLTLPQRWPEIASLLAMIGTFLWFGGQVSESVANNAENIERTLKAMEARDDAIMDRVVKLEDRRDAESRQLARIEALLSVALQRQDINSTGKTGDPR